MVYQTIPLAIARSEIANHKGLFGNSKLKTASVIINSPLKPSKIESFFESEIEIDVSPVIEIF